jgi:hypothetical protein
MYPYNSFRISEFELRISGTTPGNSNPEKAPELSSFELRISGQRPALALFFQIVLHKTSLFRISTFVLRVSGQSPAIGFVFSS